MNNYNIRWRNNDKILLLLRLLWRLEKIFCNIGFISLFFLLVIHNQIKKKNSFRRLKIESRPIIIFFKKNIIYLVYVTSSLPQEITRKTCKHNPSLRSKKTKNKNHAIISVFGAIRDTHLNISNHFYYHGHYHKY